MGEDACMFILAFLMLPIVQEYLFPPIYPTISSENNSIPLPSYFQVLSNIIGVAFGLETILTVIFFALLEKSGMPLKHNTSFVEFRYENVFSALAIMFMLACFLVVVTVTFYY